MELKLVVPICFAALVLQFRVQSAPTTVRPYAFGFDLDGVQHRTEVRTDDGIIKGEYGFQTADGYYITTVYETDKEGRFRVKSVKRSKKPTPPPSPIPSTTPTPPQTQRGPVPPPREKIYQFNYTAPYPDNPYLGHQEMGFSDTSKMGDYFRKTEDGWGYVVNYNADDQNGFVPKVKISFGN